MTIDKNYVLKHKSQIVKDILAGEIFIYPTDTIYGIGCNALNEKSVAKIRRLKQRETKPFSVIAPSMTWIKENCEVDDKVEKYLTILPGPYTLFLRLKNFSRLPTEINLTKDGTIGVRIPKHWFTNIISETGAPFITTSVNLSGKPHMKKIDELDETIKNSVRYIVYEGKISNEPSRKIDLTK